MRSSEEQPSGTVPRLRELRRDAPEPERRLLRALRDTFPHLKWRHQSPVGPFRVDILCFSEKLVIEVDGDTHAGAETKDAARTRFLNGEGYCVIRFSNDDVTRNVDGVIVTVAAHLPSPLVGEGGAKRRMRGSGEA